MSIDLEWREAINRIIHNASVKEVVEFLLRESRDKDNTLRKIKALADRPGTPGEKAAAERAYKALKAELEPKSTSKKSQPKPKRKRSIWGPGGMNYESASEWQKRLSKGPIVIRFVSEWSQSKWKQVNTVSSLSGIALLHISEYPSGINKSLLLMDRSKLGRYGIEFKSGSL